SILRRPTPPRRQNPHPTPRPVPPQTNAAVSHQSTVTLTRRTTPQHDHGHQAQSTYHMNESRHATSRIITYRLQAVLRRTPHHRPPPTRKQDPAPAAAGRE